MTEDKEKLAQLIESIECAMLTTIAKDGSLHSRPMVTRRMDEDGSLWFFTNDNSTKVAELYDHKQVNVAYQDPKTQRYVAVSGVGELVRDTRKARELWHPSLSTWFPDGLEDPHLALIRIRIRSAEYWDKSA